MTVKMGLTSRGLRVLVLVTIACLASKEEIPVTVSRRLSGDSYQYFNSSSLPPLCLDDLTYLVSEDRCVGDQELFVINGNHDIDLPL